MRSINAIVSLLVLLVLSGSPNSLADTSGGQDVYNRMVKNISESRNLGFDFTRIMESSFTGGADTIHGNVKIKGEELSKISFDDRIIIAHGDTIYDYSGSYNQMTISLSGNGGNFRELLISEYFDGFEVTNHEVTESGIVLFDLDPLNDDKRYFNVQLKASSSKSDGVLLPVSISYTDEMKRRVSWEFSLMNLNPYFSDAVFKTAIPDGCRVVNMIKR